MRSKLLAVLVVALAVIALCRPADAESRTVAVQVTVDSESSGSEAYRAMDGDPKTFWRTPWEPHRRRHPHEITIDLGESTEISGFRYRPTRGGGNGAIKDYEFFVSQDENNFGSPTAKGTFDDADSEKRVTLDEKTTGRYVKLRALSEIHRQGWTSIAELRIDAEGVEFRAALPRPEETSALAATARLGHRPPKDSLEDTLDLALRTLAFVEQSAPQSRLAAELRSLEKRIGGGDKSRGMLEELRRVRRKIILAHPALRFDKLLINKRPPPRYSHMCDQYLGRHSQLGPGLVVLESWKDNPKARVLLKDKLPEGSVLHPDLSFDGRRVLFSFCDHTITDGKQRRFLIYETDTNGSRVRQLTGTDDDPMEGWEGRQTVLIEDFDPCYLPDGGFAFVSTRSQSFGRCHGSRYVPTYLLFRAAGDGSGIRQLSFGEANEWDPAVMHNGRIIYTRWDYINRHDVRFQSLWTIAPDGTSTAHFYGNYSPSPCMTAEAQAVPGSHQIVTTATAHHSYTTGSIILVDPHIGQDGHEPLSRITPEIRYPEASDPSGGGGEGVFATPYPLSEELFFISYTPNRHVGQGGVMATNAYGIYLVDSLGGRELIYRDPQMSCFSPIPIRSRPRPPVIPSFVAGREEMETGVFYVQNVYQCTQPLEPGSIKRMRINRIHGQPNNSKPQLSLANNEIIKNIVGTVPVDGDGSVAFRAPAGVPLQLQLLDNDGMAVMTMRTVVYLQPGEVASCVGCHEQRGSTPVRHARRINGRIHDPTPSAGPQYPGGFSFARSVQPVLDRYCIECHGLQARDAGLNLLGTRENGYNAAHNGLTGRSGLVKVAYRNQETEYSTPKEYYAHAGRLAKYLLEEHQDEARLDRDSFQRIADWLDLNAQYYGDYSRNRVEDRGTSGDGEKALREFIKEQLGDQLAREPLEALVNVAQPSESRILMAPLATGAGGWGQFTRWRNTSDPNYRKMEQLVAATVKPQDAFDVAGTCGRDRCACGTCWSRHIREARNNPPVEFDLEAFPRSPRTELKVEDIPKDGWKLVHADSEETEATDTPATAVLDDDRATYWFTQCQGGRPAHPHDVVIDLGATHPVCGFRLLPRGGLGDVRHCEFFVGDNPENLGKPVTRGTLTDRRAEQTVYFDTKPGRYVMFRALSEWDGSPYTSVRELAVLAVKPEEDSVAGR